MKSIISAFFKRELTYRFLYKTDLYIIILVPILNIISFYLLGKFANAFSYFDMDVSAIRFIVFSVLIFYFSWEIVNNIISSIVEQKKILMHYLETPATQNNTFFSSCYHLLGDRNTPLLIDTRKFITKLRYLLFHHFHLTF